MKWHFRQMSRAEINADPTEGDFFNVDVLENMADALVRETIQNSLDAKLPDTTTPVQIHFRLHHMAPETAQSDAHEFFSELWPHIKSTDVLDNPPEESENLDWLTIEDYGTRGLLGDFTAYDDPPADQRNDFYYFWRNIGRGQKVGSERGRWGLGKTVFPASSRLNAFFGATLSCDDYKYLLMGQCILKIHHIDGAKYYPYGHFGILDKIDDDGFVLPIDSTDDLFRFSKIFNTNREDQPGLSIVIPYVREGINKENLIDAVIRHYYYPIIAGQLEIRISDSDSQIDLNQSNLESEAARILPDKATPFLGMLSLAKEFLEIDEKSIIVAAKPPSTRSPAWAENMFGAEQLERLAQEFDAGTNITVRIPVYVKLKGEDAKLSHFYLILKRDHDLDSAEDAFIRQGITISGVSSLREPGIRAMVIAEDSILASFLGDAENPAHTEWQPRSRNFKGKYDRGPSTLEFVKTAPRSMMRLLNKRSEMIDETALRRFFPVSDNASPPSKKQAGTTDHNPTKTAPPKPEIRSRPKRISLSRTTAGFSIKLTENGANDIPLRLVVRCAYDTGNGNPFKRWNISDFDLLKLPHTLHKADLIEAQGNRLVIEINDLDFNVAVSGFDLNRDVIVDARIEDINNA
ncbi:MAG: hypothetical protein ACRDHZ_01140 [Ktedonobacteraceae bacterium]